MLAPVKYKVDNNYEEKVLNEFRKHLIKQFQDQATGCRVTARVAKTKKATDKFEHKGENYDYVVECLRAIEFKT